MITITERKCTEEDIAEKKSSLEFDAGIEYLKLYIPHFMLTPIGRILFPVCFLSSTALILLLAAIKNHGIRSNAAIYVALGSLFCIFIIYICTLNDKKK